MPFLFSYGTLQHEDVQRSTFGRRLRGDADQLPGYEPARVPIEDPLVVAATGTTHHADARFTGREESRVAGMVFEVTDAELERVDAYEAAFAYRRTAVTLASGRRAWVYAHTPPTP
jgi:gamma-glutamylcyclotransferase (GGCT)/AIG2-like uncharacterized protein YtfP